VLNDDDSSCLRTTSVASGQGTGGTRMTVLRPWVLGLSASLAVALVALRLVGVSGLTPTADAQTAGTMGQWSTVQSWPVLATHLHLLPTGKFMFHPSWAAGDNPYIWDPLANTFTAATHAGYDLFCSASVLLSNGQLFFAGGNDVNDTTAGTTGLPNASIYDPNANSWTYLPNMNAGRWYPSTTLLSNGDVLVLSGSMDSQQHEDPLPQVWQVASGSWRNLTTAQTLLSWYPHMHLAPNGQVFDAGDDGGGSGLTPSATTYYLNTSGTGAWTTVANRNVVDRRYGPSVMYDSGKVIYIGGGDPPTATAEIIDLNSATPTWQYTGSMAFPRRQNNATLLPDGKILVSGGSSGPGNDDATHPVYPAEMWDPATGRFTTMATLSTYRGYHSTALLLPDGRVVTAGGEYAGANAEIYSPPYLFNGARPSITSAPTGVAYGQAFFVGTPDATTIAQVTWLRLGTVTHTFNMEQRFGRLTFTQASGGLNVTAPSNSNVTPPGYYMLFILNSSGVPSLARIVQINQSVSGGPTPTPTATPVSTATATPFPTATATPSPTVTLSPPTAPSNLKATVPGKSRKVNLSWTDNSSNETGFSIERSTAVTSFAQIATVGAGVTSYSDSSVAAATTYSYRIRAVNNAGYSDYSNTASATTP
jgi:galactose oxidase